MRKLFSSRCVSLVFALAVSGVIPARGSLVGLYQFNDPSNLGHDSSVFHNDLEIFGTGVSYTSAGAYDGGLSLSGSGGLTTSTGDVPSFFPLHDESYTISLAFSTFQNQIGFIGWGNYGTVNQVNAIRSGSNSSGTDPSVDTYWWGYDLSSSPYINLLDGVFHTVTVTYDGTIESLYVDGALVNYQYPGTHDGQNGNFTVGEACSTCSGGGNFYSGTLDNVAIYNQALTSDQVSQIAAGQFAAQDLAAVDTPELGTLVLIGPTMLLGAAALSLRKRFQIQNKPIFDLRLDEAVGNLL